jgi:hypothetical protein
LLAPLPPGAKCGDERNEGGSSHAEPDETGLHAFAPFHGTLAVSREGSSATTERD